MQPCLVKYCCTEECYEKTCMDTKVLIFLISCFVVILALISLSIYMVVKPTFCKGNSTTHDFLVPVPRLMNFKETSVLFYPQLVAIFEKQSRTFTCNGAILSNEWILTAGHCLLLCKDSKCGDLNVRIGSSYANTDGIVLAIEQYEIHPKFGRETLQNDVGLIRVRPFTINGQNVKAAELSKLRKPNHNGKLVGWMSMSKSDLPYQKNKLKLINLTTKPRETCNDYVTSTNNTFTIDDSMLCAITAYENGCYITSGATFFQEDTILGISVTRQTNNDYEMYFFMKISEFLDFFESFVTISKRESTKEMLT